MRRRTWIAILLSLLAAMLVLAPTAATASPAQGQPSTGQPAANALVIGFDVSVSIREDAFDTARAAAIEFVEGLADSPIDVGLLSVGNDPSIRVDITSDRAAVVAGINALVRDSPQDETYIYQSLKAALPALQGYQNPQILLFTDGHEEGDEPIDVVTGELRSRQPAIPVSSIYVPAATPVPGDRDILQDLADATGGQVYEVDQGEALITSVQSNLTRALNVVAAPSATVTTPTTTELALTTPSATVAALPPPPQAELLPDWLYLAAAGAVALGLLVATVVIAGIAGRANTPKERRRRGLEAYSLNPQGPVRAPPPPTRLGDNPIARTAVDLADRVVRSRHAEETLTRRLESANLPLRPGEWLLLQMLAAAVLGLLLLALSGGNPVALLAGAVIGGAGPWVFLLSRAQRRRNAFQAVLPDTLGLLASTLRVGYSLPQAMDSVVREGREPVKTEFTRALVEARLGVPAERTLDSIAERVDSDDFRWVVMAIRIQREVGGNLAELLDTVAETMRERARLRRQVATLSAEGKISAWIVGGLPIAFILYLLVASPSYLLPLVTDPLGILLLVAAVVLFAVGLAGLRWAITVDV